MPSSSSSSSSSSGSDSSSGGHIAHSTHRTMQHHAPPPPAAAAAHGCISHHDRKKHHRAGPRSNSPPPPHHHHHRCHSPAPPSPHHLHHHHHHHIGDSLRLRPSKPPKKVRKLMKRSWKERPYAALLDGPRALLEADDHVLGAYFYGEQLRHHPQGCCLHDQQELKTKGDHRAAEYTSHSYISTLYGPQARLPPPPPHSRGMGGHHRHRHPRSQSPAAPRLHEGGYYIDQYCRSPAAGNRRPCIRSEIVGVPAEPPLPPPPTGEGAPITLAA